MSTSAAMPEWRGRSRAFYAKSSNKTKQAQNQERHSYRSSRLLGATRYPDSLLIICSESVLTNSSTRRTCGEEMLDYWRKRWIMVNKYAVIDGMHTYIF